MDLKLDREFRHGRIAMIICVVMGLNPFLLFFALIAYIFGAASILLSKKEQLQKAIWILAPLFIVGMLFWYYTSR